MGNWNDLLDEITEIGSEYDFVRRKYIKKLSEYTGRNTIAYYSAWLQKPGAPNVSISDADKTGFMTTINKLDFTKGLDIVLHTPGGDVTATESLVDYFKSVFGTNIRAIVPELAMSAGTMIACACKEIVMGKHSSLGPIDPQLYGLPAHGVVEEFQHAVDTCSQHPEQLEFWKLIIGKYGPTFLGDCQKAIQLSKSLVTEWLKAGMLAPDPDRDIIADRIVTELTDHSTSKTHARHLSASYCKNLGLKIVMLEDDQDLQEHVLSMHHAYMHTISRTGAVKVIENDIGYAFINGLKN